MISINISIRQVLNKQFVLAIAVLLIVFSIQCSAANIEGKVIKVADGDTVTVLDQSDQQHRVRLTGIDAPERHQAYGSESTESLIGLVYLKKVIVQSSGKDRYKRVLGKILLEGLDVNLEQVKRGFAWHYKQYEKDQTSEDQISYAQAEVLARQQQLGLWVLESPIPPWEYRRGRR
jgi:endonuclease YncB( thermonuclease family)